MVDAQPAAVTEHFETWLELASAGQFDGQGDHHTPVPYVVLAKKSSVLNKFTCLNFKQS